VPARPHEALRHDDAAEPSSEEGRVAQLPQATPSGDEGLLDHIITVVPLGQPLQGDGVGGPLVAAYECPKGLRVAFAGPLHQPRLSVRLDHATWMPHGPGKETGIRVLCATKPNSRPSIASAAARAQKAARGWHANQSANVLLVWHRREIRHGPKGTEPRSEARASALASCRSAQTVRADARRTPRCPYRC
jgi:hypothetical protein